MRKTSAPGAPGDITSVRDRLESLALLVEGLGPEGYDHACAIRDVIAARGALSLDAAVGLVPAPGGEPWHTQERRAERDHLLRLLAEAIAPGASIAAKARAVASAVRRHGALSRRYEPPAPAYPDRTLWTEREILAELFRASGGNIPTGLSQLREILSRRACR